MPKHSSSSITSFLLILCSLSLALAFNPTLQARYFYMAQQNYLTSELDQTRNGIIGFSIEAAGQSYQSQQTISQYALIDLPNRDVKAILTDLVSACEDIEVTPTFQNLHYHIQTDTLAYFCYNNNSLLLIDQSTYTVEQVIPFNISGSWPAAKLSTEGMGLAILLMGDLLATTTKASLLVKVDLQARAVTSAINLNQGFGSGESVVAYASGKKGAYIATNKIQKKNMVTTIYSINFIGKQYQITSIHSFSLPTTYVKTITKLFCLGNFVAVNNGQNLYFLNQQGGIEAQVELDFRSSNTKGTNFYDVTVTIQSEGAYLYLKTSEDVVYQYSVLANVLHSKKLGDFGDMKIAYGNSTSGDLMLTLDIDRVNFTIYDIKTMNQVYFAPCGYNDHMMTDSTYVVQYGDAYIFDLKSNDIIATPRAANQVYHTKEQHIISEWFIETMDTCHLQHTDLITGKVWITIRIKGYYDCGTFDKLRLSENGNPEYILHRDSRNYTISTDTDGQLTFDTGSTNIKRGINFDLDNLSFYELNSTDDLNQINITFYTYNSQSKQFEYQDSNILNNVTVENLVYSNTTQSFVVGDKTLVVVNGVGRNAEKYSFSQEWNFVSSIQDAAGNSYPILTKYNVISFIYGPVPGVLINGQIVDLPGTRKESIRAQAAGLNSYWVADSLRSSFGAVRFYRIDSSKRAGEKISI